MNRTLRKCCAALLATLAVYAAPAAEKTVYLKDFLAPGAAGTDAVPAVRAALEHCAEVGASRLVLPGDVEVVILDDHAVARAQQQAARPVAAHAATLDEHLGIFIVGRHDMHGLDPVGERLGEGDFGVNLVEAPD